jgi:hypothetical protein
MVTQLRYKYHEPIDGFGDDYVCHRIVVPAHCEFNSLYWDKELLIGHSIEDGRLAQEIVTAVNEHLFALAVQVAKETEDSK